MSSDRDDWSAFDSRRKLSSPSSHSSTVLVVTCTGSPITRSARSAASSSASRFGISDDEDVDVRRRRSTLAQVAPAAQEPKSATAATPSSSANSRVTMSGVHRTFRTRHGARRRRADGSRSLGPVGRVRPGQSSPDPRPPHARNLALRSSESWSQRPQPDQSGFALARISQDAREAGLGRQSGESEPARAQQPS